MIRIFFASVGVAAVVIAGAGLVTIGYGLLRILAAWRTKGWPQVPGTVLTSTVEEKRTAQHQHREEGGAEPDVHVFKAAVTYRYKVGEKELEGSRLTPDELQTSNRNTAEAHAARYPAGAAVQVSYQPSHPSNAVLEPGISGASAILPAVGAGLVGLGGAMFGLAWKLSGH